MREHQPRCLERRWSWWWSYCCCCEVDEVDEAVVGLERVRHLLVVEVGEVDEAAVGLEPADHLVVVECEDELQREGHEAVADLEEAGPGCRYHPVGIDHHPGRNYDGGVGGVDEGHLGRHRILVRHFLAPVGLVVDEEHGGDVVVAGLARAVENHLVEVEARRAA